MMKTIVAVVLTLALCAPASSALERGKSKGQPGSSKLGVVDIRVVDEDDRSIAGVDVSIGGKPVRKNPFSHRAGTFKIKARSDDVGEMTSEIKIKAGEINKFSIKFFRLRENVTSLVTIPAERYHGTIILLNCLEGETNVIVDRKEGDRTDAFDGKIIKGSGSLKISNLAVGTYEVEVRRQDGEPVPGCPGGCKTDVPLKKGQTVLVQADSDGVHSSTQPLACGAARKRTER